MTSRRDKSDADADAAVSAGLYALGGPVYVGARLLGGFLDEGPSRSRDLGPAPIGSDPWLRSQIRSAIEADPGLAASGAVVAVEAAVVTLTGRVDETHRARLERAVRTVQGIKRLVVAFDA